MKIAGQVTLLGILVMLMAISSCLSAISQMHWSLLRMKVRSQVYQCHVLVVCETEKFIQFIGSTNKSLQALSLIPPTPATMAKILALKKGIQISQKIRTASFIQKLQAKKTCSLKNIINVARSSPYQNLKRHPVDGTMILTKPVWSYQLQVSTSSDHFLGQDYSISLSGSFNLTNRFGNFSRGKLYEIL